MPEECCLMQALGGAQNKKRGVILPLAAYSKIFVFLLPSFSSSINDNPNERVGNERLGIVLVQEHSHLLCV